MENEKNQSYGYCPDELPVNLIPGEERPSFTGFIIIRLSAYVDPGKMDLRKPGGEQLPGLTKFLHSHPEIVTERLITSVSPTKLLEMEEKASHSEFPPLHSLTTYWRLDCRKVHTRTEELLKNLQQLPEVDLAYLEQSASDPAVNAANDTFAADQRYLEGTVNGNQIGIDARWAWTQANGDGAGVGFVDLEQSWNLSHEDLIGKAPTRPVFNDNRYGPTFRDDHGTAVLGIVAGVDNALGIVGVAPGVTSVRIVSRFKAATNNESADSDSHIADAIVAAINVMARGDVLLLEVQRDVELAGRRTYLPTEIDAGDFAAIRLAAGTGIIVIESAGNGNNDLDALPAGSRLHGDSGAIMVGSCYAAWPHTRFVVSQYSGSNYGSRINCFAWGQRITTAGYGSLAGTTHNTKYTFNFGGTSGAAAIIAGAALIVQGKYQATPPTGRRLSPSQMRAILSNPATGIRQGATPGVVRNIGVMPNLRAIFETSLV